MINIFPKPLLIFATITFLASMFPHIGFSELIENKRLVDFIEGEISEGNNASRIDISESLVDWIAEFEGDDSEIWIKRNLTLVRTTSLQTEQDPLLETSILRQYNAQNARIYSNKIIEELSSHYEIRVILLEKMDGNFEIVAHIMFHSI